MTEQLTLTTTLYELMSETPPDIDDDTIAELLADKPEEYVERRDSGIIELSYKQFADQESTISVEDSENHSQHTETDTKNIITGSYTPTEKEKKRVIESTQSGSDDSNNTSNSSIVAAAGQGATNATVGILKFIGWLFMRLFEICTSILIFCCVAIIGLYVITALIPGTPSKPFLVWGAMQLGVCALVSAGLSVIASRIAGEPNRYDSGEQSLKYR